MLDLTRSRSDWAWKPKYVDIGKVVTVKKTRQERAKHVAVFTWCISSCPLRSFASTAFPGQPHSLHSLLVHSTRNIIIILLWVYQTRFLLRWMCEIRLDWGIYYQLEDRDQEAQHNVMPLKNGHKSIRCDIISIHGKAKSFEYVYFKNDNNITHLCNRDISNESKWAAKSESVFSKLIPFKNFHVWWILLVSQIRLLDPHQTDL